MTKSFWWQLSLAGALIVTFCLSQAGSTNAGRDHYNNFWKDSSGDWLCGFKAEGDQIKIYNNSQHRLLFEVLSDYPSCSCTCLVARDFISPKSSVPYLTSISSSRYYSFTIWGRSGASHCISGEEALQLMFKGDVREDAKKE